MVNWGKPEVLDMYLPEGFTFEGESVEPGHWRSIDFVDKGNRRYYLFEHQFYGDEIACIIADDTMDIKIINVHDGLDELSY